MSEYQSITSAPAHIRVGNVIGNTPYPNSGLPLEDVDVDATIAVTKSLSETFKEVDLILYDDVSPETIQNVVDLSLSRAALRLSGGKPPTERERDAMMLMFTSVAGSDRLDHAHFFDDFAHNVSGDPVDELAVTHRRFDEPGRLYEGVELDAQRNWENAKRIFRDLTWRSDLYPLPDLSDETAPAPIDKVNLRDVENIMDAYLRFKDAAIYHGFTDENTHPAQDKEALSDYFELDSMAEVTGIVAKVEDAWGKRPSKAEKDADVNRWVGEAFGRMYGPGGLSSPAQVVRATPIDYLEPPKGAIKREVDPSEVEWAFPSQEERELELPGADRPNSGRSGPEDQDDSHDLAFTEDDGPEL